jgi:hypothetical protein
VVRDSGAEDCPGAEVLAAEVNRRLGRGALAASSRSQGRGVFVQIARTAEGYHGVLSAVGGAAAGREVFDEGSSCIGMAEALAVTLAILVDRPGSPTPAKYARRPQPAPDPRRVATDEVLLIGPAAGYGLADGVAPGVVGEMHFKWSVWSAGLGGLWFAPRRLAFAPGQVVVSHWAVAARGCWAVAGWSGGRLEACLWPFAGRIRGEGEGFAPDRSAQRLWFGAAAGAVVAGRIVGRLGWEARLAAGASPRRQRFVVDGGGMAFESAPAFALGALALSVSIW